MTIMTFIPMGLFTHIFGGGGTRGRETRDFADFTSAPNEFFGSTICRGPWPRRYNMMGTCPAS